MILGLGTILENRRTYFNKYKSQPDINSVLTKFWEIKSRLSSPENDIDWWINRPFEDLKRFVLDFNATNKSDRRQNEINSMVTAYGAECLGTKRGYEIWYVPNYESAQLLGRNYKNRPTHWCISSDDPEYWFETYDQSEFIFLIREKIKYDDHDKIAIQFMDGGRYFDIDQITVWNLNDEKEYDSTIIPYDLIHHAWELFKYEGCMKDDTVY